MYDVNNNYLSSYRFIGISATIVFVFIRYVFFSFDWYIFYYTRYVHNIYLCINEANLLVLYLMLFWVLFDIQDAYMSVTLILHLTQSYMNAL